MLRPSGSHRVMELKTGPFASSFDATAFFLSLVCSLRPTRRMYSASWDVLQVSRSTAGTENARAEQISCRQSCPSMVLNDLWRANRLKT